MKATCCLLDATLPALAPHGTEGDSESSPGVGKVHQDLILAACVATALSCPCLQMRGYFPTSHTISYLFAFGYSRMASLSPPTPNMYTYFCLKFMHPLGFISSRENPNRQKGLGVLPFCVAIETQTDMLP